MKKRVIISLLAAVLLFTGCNTKGEIAKKEEEKLYFDFTHTEILRHLEENSFMEFTPITVTDLDENGERIATYTAKTLIYGEENVEEYVHYQFSYDDVTKKVRSVIILLKRNAVLASSRYPWHIRSIVEYICPNDEKNKAGELSPLIQEGFDKNDFAIYEGENFKLSASRMEEYFDAYFTPIKKGE